MRVLGLDIGGANIKAADNDGVARSRPFALWRSPELLVDELRQIIDEFGRVDRLAVTMTGELCDCFATKAEGVAFILDAVEEAAQETPMSVWQTGAEFLTPDVARDLPMLVAAANWHALATFCGRIVPAGNALLIDVGSTTTDIIPLVKGLPIPAGLTDLERLQTGELVYTGVSRTPVCAVASEVVLEEAAEAEEGFNPSPRPSPLGGRRGRSVGLAAEVFATLLDVYLILGEIPERPEDCDTANGKPATRECAKERLARMLCCDRTELSTAAIQSIATQIRESQRQLVADAIDRVLPTFAGACRQVIVSGSGTFFARQVVAGHASLGGAEVQSLTELLSPAVAEAACAFALARLASERA